MINFKYIRAELVRNEVSVLELSKIIHKGKSTTYRKLQGKTRFTAEELGKIARHLNVDIKLFYNN